MTNVVEVTEKTAEGELASDILSLILFVQLALAADADKQLGPTGCSRTHHRILFLVALKPGVTVGEIVNLLRLSAQAIQAPLRNLIDDGLIQQESSERDRRKRHLSITERGKSFLENVSKTQFARIAHAHRQAGDQAIDGFLRVMRAMTSEEDHAWLYPQAEAPKAAVRPFEQVDFAK